MSVSDTNKNRGTHGDSSFMLGRLRPSSENPPALAVGSVKYRNLVYIKHPEEIRRSYLYELPPDADIKGGEKLCVRDRRGEHIGVATSPNFYASETMTQTLCECNGGYYPPAKVIGTVEVVTIRQEIVKPFTSEEEIPF